MSFSSDGKYLAVAIVNGHISVFAMDANLGEKKLDGSESEPGVSEPLVLLFSLCAGIRKGTSFLLDSPII